MANGDAILEITAQIRAAEVSVSGIAGAVNYPDVSDVTRAGGFNPLHLLRKAACKRQYERCY